MTANRRREPAFRLNWLDNDIARRVRFPCAPAFKIEDGDLPPMSMPAPGTSPIRGYLYIAGGTLFWGISATMGRAAFTGRLLPGGRALGPIDPLILAQSRTTFSFCAF